MDINDWPFLIAKDNDELTVNILNFDSDDFNFKIQKYLKALGTFENGNATNKVTNFILSNLK